MENIERFNLLTAYLLGKLYAEFPVGRPFYSDDVRKDLRECFTSEDGKEHGRFIGQTLMWLEETKYIIGRGGGTRKEYVLSPRAFEVLQALPSALRGDKAETNEKSLGEKLSEVAVGMGREVAKETQRQVASQLVGQVIGHAMRAWSGS